MFNQLEVVAVLTTKLVMVEEAELIKIPAAVEVGLMTLVAKVSHMPAEPLAPAVGQAVLQSLPIHNSGEWILTVEVADLKYKSPADKLEVGLVVPRTR